MILLAHCDIYNNATLKIAPQQMQMSRHTIIVKVITFSSEHIIFNSKRYSMKACEYEVFQCNIIEIAYLMESNYLTPRKSQMLPSIAGSW